MRAWPGSTTRPSTCAGSGRPRPEASHEVDRDELSFAIAESGDRLGGHTSADQVANVLRAVDQAWQRELYRQRVEQRSRVATIAHEPAATTIAELQGALDDRTALLDLYEGSYQGNSVLYVGVYVRAYLRRFGSFVDQPVGVLTRYNRKNPARPLTFHADFERIVRLRRLIADEPPGSRPVTREARPLLEDSWLSVLRPALPELDEAGYERLVIWPHGGLHYAPLSSCPSTAPSWQTGTQ